MTSLQRIIQTAETQCPPDQFQYVVTYGRESVYDVVQEQRVTKPLIVIAIGRETPRNYDEDGRVSQIAAEFSIYYREHADVAHADEAYERYTRLRNVFLDPLTFDDGVLQWIGSESSRGDGIAESSIDLLAVSSTPGA